MEILVSAFAVAVGASCLFTLIRNEQKKKNESRSAAKSSPRRVDTDDRH